MRSTKQGMVSSIILSIILSLLLFSHGAIANNTLMLNDGAGNDLTEYDWIQYEWLTLKQQEGVSLATTKIPNSKFLAIKTQMVVKSDLASVLAETLDVDSFPLWVKYCVEAKVIHRDQSKSSFTQYTVSRPPWPLKRRDVLMDVRIQYQDTEKIIITGKVSDREYPKPKGTVRIDNVRAVWKFTLLDDGIVNVENFIHADPGGVIPAWLNNRLMVNSPLKTFIALRKRLEERSL